MAKWQVTTGFVGDASKAAPEAGGIHAKGASSNSYASKEARDKALTYGPRNTLVDQYEGKSARQSYVDYLNSK